MATTVSHAMRRYSTNSPDTKYSNFSSIRSESSPSLDSPPTGVGGSALSRSMRYAEPWLYGSVRGAPVLVAAAYSPSSVGMLSTPLIHLCSCIEYNGGGGTVSGRGNKSNKGVCKKCKGARIPTGSTRQQKYGTVRGYPTTPSQAQSSVRAGTVRVTTSSRPSILPQSASVDPYDLMRRSRLSCPEVGSQFRARSTSPNKSRISNNNFTSRTGTNSSSSSSKSSRNVRTNGSNRSPSPSTNNLTLGRRSILECDVNPYELMTAEHQGGGKNTNNSSKSIKTGRFVVHTDYEDVEMPAQRGNSNKISQIPKLQNLNKSSKKTHFATTSSNNLSGAKRDKPVIEREMITRNEAKFKSILKKPSTTFSDIDLSTTDIANAKSGSHFYLPMPTLTPPRKKVQFLVENENDTSNVQLNLNLGGIPNGITNANNAKREDSPPVQNQKQMQENSKEHNVSHEDEDHLFDDLDDEPCRLKRSLSERLGHEAPNVCFNDTMALRTSRNRTSINDNSTLFEAVTDLQRLDGISTTRPRPREPPPPPPPPSPPTVEVTVDRPATPPPRSVTEIGSGYEVTILTKMDLEEKSEKKVQKNQKKEEEKTNQTIESKLNKTMQNNLETPPCVPPRKRSNSKQPLTAQIVVPTNKEEILEPPAENNYKISSIIKTVPDTQTEKTNEEAVKKEEISIMEKNEPVVFDTPRITIKSAVLETQSSYTENISSTKIESPDVNYSYQKFKIEASKPSKTIVQINSPTIQIIPSTVHRLQIKNEFPDLSNYNHVVVKDSPQRKTSIMINGDDCYSTVNVNDDIPIYQSSVVVNDYDCSKIEVGSSGKSSTVYITGDFQSSTPLTSRTSISEERPKKTLVILEGNSSAPSTPKEATPPESRKSFIILQEEKHGQIEQKPVKDVPPYEEQVVKRNKANQPKNRKERKLPKTPKEAEEKIEIKDKVDTKDSKGDVVIKPSSEELQRLLKDPVEAVKRNLIPHVCGKADVERRIKMRKPITSNSLVARLLEDPFLGTLAEGLETNTVAKLIEDSLLKLRSQDYQDDDKDACSENDYPPYELIEAGSDCYSNHSNRSSVTEDELGQRSKFYQLLADSALQEIEDHHYEIIKANSVDPIYEEIEIPPPLPSVPPPSDIIDDIQIDKQFTTRSIFEGASKYDILSYLVDAKERGIIPEESYTYNFNNSGEVIVEEEEENKGRGVFSSRVSHMSTVSDSSEDSSLVITAEKNGPQKSAEVERNDSGVGSETSKCSRSRYLSQPETSNSCEDCDLIVDPQPEDGPLICKKCSKKRSERKETITEIVETEEKYSRDLQIILEEFYQPMLVAGLLTPEQLTAIFLNSEELLENSQALAERLRDTLEIATEQGDEDLGTVNIGKIFLEAAPMLHGFESYCVRQGAASLLLASLEKEKELLRIFLRVSQMENTVLRRMNLNSFLMVPVQRVTKYPLLLARLYKVTPLHHESRELLREAQHKIELHLSHMNSETKDVPSKLWRRISNNSGRRSSSEMDLVNIKLRKIAVDVLEWNHDEARFALEGRLLFTQPTDNNWRKGRTIKLTPINALLVTNGKPSASQKSDRNGNTPNGVLIPNGNNINNEDDNALTFPRHTGVREAALLLVRDKGGRYSLLREPLYLDRCVIATDPAWHSYFEVQELLGKDTFIFKAEDTEMTRTWYRQLQYHAQGMGAWRKRRNALANIMINGMGSRS